MKQPMKKGSFVPKKYTRGGIGWGLVGWGGVLCCGSCRVGWGGSCRGGVGHIGGGHAGVGWGGSCRVGMGHTGVE